ncbi:MAG: sodium:solute symporter family protein [Bacteroidia bacterium]|nr:sodium:solute symporter family protein [Bacteroidia bacterium]
MLAFSIILYIAITLFLGYRASFRVKNTLDYTLAGRSLPAVMVGITIFATWFGPEMIMGVPDLFVREGIQGIIIDQFGVWLCLILLGLFYTRPLYRLKIITINDFFRLRYNAAIEKVSSIINVITYFSWIAAQFLALALLFNTLLGIPVSLGIVIGAAIVLIYTYIGGMWAVSVTDLIQSVMIIAGLMYLMVWILGKTGGIAPIISRTPVGFFRFFPEPGFYNGIDYLGKWMVFGLGTIPAQELYQRVLAAKSEQAGVNGAYISGILLFIFGSIPLIIGLAISQLHPEIIAQSDGQNMIPNMVFQYTGLPMQILFFGALVSAILSTSSGALLAPATVIGENLVKPYFPTLTDKQLLLITRLSVIFVAVVSCIMAFFNSNIHGLVVDSATLILVCLFVPYTGGIYWKKSSVTGVWAAIIGGGLAWAICAYGLETRIDPIIYGTLASLVCMVAVSLIFPDDSYAQYRKTTTARL